MIVELLEDKNYKINYLGYMAEILKKNDYEIEDFLDLQKFDKYYTINKLVIEIFMMNGEEFGDYIEYED